MKILVIIQSSQNFKVLKPSAKLNWVFFWKLPKSFCSETAFSSEIRYVSSKKLSSFSNFLRLSSRHFCYISKLSRIFNNFWWLWIFVKSPQNIKFLGKNSPLTSFSQVRYGFPDCPFDYLYEQWMQYQLTSVRWKSRTPNYCVWQGSRSSGFSTEWESCLRIMSTGTRCQGSLRWVALDCWVQKLSEDWDLSVEEF